MNDTERSQWVDNDEGLYRLWKFSKLSKTQFVRTRRVDIDAVIKAIVSGKQPAHFLAYEGKDK